jgi:hypothetical protein
VGDSEEWRTAGSAGIYEVSNRGRIRRADTRELKEPTKTASGFLVVNLYEQGRTNVTAVHSVVAHAFLGPRDSAFMVRHKDGDRTNCDASNLEYVKLGARIPRKASDQGKHLVGKLNGDQAAEIRRRAKAGESVKSLAERYGVSSCLVSNIKHGKKWKDA